MQKLIIKSQNLALLRGTGAKHILSFFKVDCLWSLSVNIQFLSLLHLSN